MLRPASLLALAGLLLAVPADAQCTTSWAAPVSGFWNNAANWTAGVPDAADVVCITVDGTYTVTLNVNATITALDLGDADTTFVDPRTLLVNGNSLTMTDNSAVNRGGVLDWRSGTLATGAGASLTNAGTLLMSTGGNKELNTGTIINTTGLVTWTGGTLFIGNGSTFENRNLFDVQANVEMRPIGAGNTFRNTATGTYRRSAGTGDHVIIGGVVFENFGTVNVQTGTLRFDGSSTHTDATVTASAGAQVRFNTKVHTIVGTLSGSPAGSVFMDAATFLQAGPGGATLDFGGTGFNWQGGQFTGGNPLTNAGLLRVTTGGNKELDQATELVNTGTVEWTQGTLSIVNGSTVVNRGLFDVQADVTMSPIGPGNTFRNAAGGTLCKCGGAGTTTIAVPVENQSEAVIDAAVGTLAFTGTLDHQAGALIQGNGTIVVPSVTNEGITGPGAARDETGILTWAGDLAITNTYRLDIELGGTTAGSGYDQLAVTGFAFLNGTLRLSHVVGFFPQVGQSFTVLTAAGVSGSFDSVEAPAGYTYDVTYNPESVVVTVTSVPNFDLNAVNLTPLTVQAGGSVQFRYAIRNNTNAAATGQLWYTATGGNQGVIRSATLAANTTAGPFDYTQPIPVTVPPGTYAYTLRIGQFPNTTVDQVEYRLVVTPVPRAAGAPEAGEVVAAGAAEAPDEAVSEAAPEASAGAERPASYALHGAAPNPFRDHATLRYDLPEAAEVRIGVYDLLGREVAVLVDGAVEAGRHQAAFDGRGLAAGVYVVRMAAGEQAFTQRLTLVR
jgi:hypothetical protein